MDQVQEIKSKVDIVSVIGEFVKLRKAGRNYQGLCPFHQEKTPSFSVSPEMQIFKCFGCGESGDVITFIEKHEGLEFVEALKVLADRAGVTLKKYDNKASKEREVLRDANEDATSFYHHILLKHNKGKKALEYVKGRGVTEDTIQEFRLGYATQDQSLMTNNLVKQKNYTARQLEDAGLSYYRYGKHMDRFRGRIIYPITDVQGRVVALAGRILPGLSDKGLAKYINSPQTKIYNKSRSLFGLDKAKHFIKQEDAVVLVEGEMDFLSSWQVGVKNVVAIKGTALTEEHIRTISRFTKKIILALDSDFAGDKAALRGITLAQNNDMQVYALDLAKHKDPDEFAQADPEGYKLAVEKAKDVWEFLIDHLDERHNLNSASGKSEASKVIIPLLGELENEIVREHYLQKLSQKMSISVSAVSKQAEKHTKNNNQKPNPSASIQHAKKPREQKLEEELLVMILRFSPQVILKPELGEQLKLRFSTRLTKIFKDYFNSSKQFDLLEFRDELPSEIGNRFKELFLEYTQEPGDPVKYINNLYRYLSEANLKKSKQKLFKKISEAEDKEDIKRVQKLQQDFKKLELTGNSSIIDKDSLKF